MRRNLSLVLAGSLLLGTAWMTGCKDKDKGASESNSAASAAGKTENDAQKASDKAGAAHERHE